MSRPITRTIARLALAAAAVTAIGGTVSGAGAEDATTTCRTWRPHAADGRTQHTWHPGDTAEVRRWDPWNPSDATDAIDRGHQDPWHPGAAGAGPQHPWSPTGAATDVLHPNTWHPAGDCP